MQDTVGGRQDDAGTLGHGLRRAPRARHLRQFGALRLARTLLAKTLEIDPLVIEAQLAHAVKDANGRAYNRTQYLKQRTVMLQRWADYLDVLAIKAGSPAVELKAAA